MKKMRKIVNLCAAIISLLCLLILAGGAIEHWIPSESEVHEALFYDTAFYGADAFYDSPYGRLLQETSVNRSKFADLYTVLLLVFTLICTLRFFKLRKGGNLPQTRKNISSAVIGFLFLYLDFSGRKEVTWFHTSLADIDFPYTIFYCVGTLYFFFLAAICVGLLFNLVIGLLSARTENKYRQTADALHGNQPFDPSRNHASATQPAIPVQAAEPAPHTAQTLAAESAARQKFCEPIRPITVEKSQPAEATFSAEQTESLSSPATEKAQPNASEKTTPAPVPLKESPAPAILSADISASATAAREQKKPQEEKEVVLSTHCFNLKTCFVLPVVLLMGEFMLILMTTFFSGILKFVFWIFAIGNLGYAGWKTTKAVLAIKRRVVVTNRRVYLQNFATGAIILSVPVTDILNAVSETTAASARSGYGNLVLHVVGGKKVGFEFIYESETAKENVLYAKRKLEKNPLAY